MTPRKSFEQIGLSADNPITGCAEHGDSITVQTSTGTYTLRSGQWRRVEPATVEQECEQG